MKKKSFFWSMMTTMMVVMLSVGITACEPDSDSSIDIVGTWSGKSDEDQITVTFYNNGSGSYIARYYETTGRETETGSFTYIGNVV